MFLASNNEPCLKHRIVNCSMCICNVTHFGHSFNKGVCSLPVGDFFSGVLNVPPTRFNSENFKDCLYYMGPTIDMSILSSSFWSSQIGFFKSVMCASLLFFMFCCRVLMQRSESQIQTMKTGRIFILLQIYIGSCSPLVCYSSHRFSCAHRLEFFLETEKIFFPEH